MYNIRIIILAISFFSLNSFSGPSKTVSQQDSFDFLDRHNMHPSITSPVCTLNNIYSALPGIIEENIQLKYITLDNGYLDFASVDAQRAAKSGIISEINSACKSWVAKQTKNSTNLAKAAQTDYKVEGLSKLTDVVPGQVCNKDGKNPATGKPCGGLVDSTKSTTPKMKDTVTATAEADKKTYVKVDNGDGTTTTVVKDENNKTVGTIETKKNGREIVRDAEGNKVRGDEKKEIIADKKEALGELTPAEKKAAGEKAEKDAAKVTKDANTGEPENSVPQEKKEEIAKEETEAERAVASIKDRLSSVPGEIQTTYNNAQAENPQNVAVMQKCTTASATYETAIAMLEKISLQEKACTRSSSIAGFLCPKVNSPAVQVASTLMNASAAIIPTLGGAKDTCQYSSKINLAGQLVLTGGSAVCMISKGRCENKCEDAKVNLAALKKHLEDIQKSNCTASVASAIPVVEAHINKDTATIAKCESYKMDAMAMTSTAANMLAAATQAKACEQQLAALEATNNTAQLYTMDEMCAQPQNVNSTVCKCRSDNTAVGCPGHIAGSGNEGNINKDLNTKGTSNMAGLSYGSKITPTGGASSLDTNLDGLSDEAKKALAAGGDQKQDGSMFGGASAASLGGGGSTAAGAAGSAGADKGKFAEEPKSIGSSFMNAVGSLFGKGGNSGKAAPAKEDKFASDKYKEQIKRQIAAEQMRSEISSASGMDNWTKIRTRYKSNAGSLIDSN